ncbi:MAG: CocE/NonD family hydrolase [Pseudomonadota bacterium]
MSKSIERKTWGWLLAICGAVLTARAAEFGPPSGTGPLAAVAESVPELPLHTTYRPVELPATPLPLFVWGNGACRDNGLEHGAFLRQIASQGYLVVALGVPRHEHDAELPSPPSPPAPRARLDETSPEQMIEAIDWAVRENSRDGSAFKGHIDVTRIAVGGHSCGGLQAIAVSEDPRIRTTLVLDSGIYNSAVVGRSKLRVEKSKLAALHGSMLYLVGGPQDIAFANTTDDVARIDHLPVFLGSLPVGHGGTFWTEPNGGAWAAVAARWLDWQLKADADASWDFAGPACRLCTNPRWSVTQKKLGLPVGPFRESRYVAARDGTRLAMNIYRGAVDGRPVTTPRPVVFSFTPYRARYRLPNGDVSELAQIRQLGLADLTERGFVVAIADLRGKGASFGARRGFQDRTEARDGYDLVQWLAAQPWASGKVGMVGCSYLGGTTVHVASTAPPALKAIFTGATDLDKYAFVSRGGVTAQFNTRPDEPLAEDLRSVPLDEDTDGGLLRTAVSEHARNTPMAPLWYGMPYRDSVSPLTGNRFWEEAGPYPYLQAIRRAKIATYFWGNWNDEPTEQVLLLAANLGGKLLVGPGSHCVAPPGYDLGGEIRRFFDHHLKGIDSGLYREPRVTYHVDGAPAGADWVRSSRLPGVGVRRSRWYLGAGNSLAVRPTAAGRDSFRVDYDVGTGDYFPFWVQSQAAHGLSYVSAPLDTARTLLGTPVVRLRIGVDRDDANVFAYLEDLAPDGSATVLAFGRLAASHRKTRRAPYDTMGLPWHSGLAADVQSLTPAKEVDLRFALTPLSRRVPDGHRLRLVITGADPRQRNLAAIRQYPPPQVTVAFGDRHPSWLDLPLR